MKLNWTVHLKLEVYIVCRKRKWCLLMHKVLPQHQDGVYIWKGVTKVV